MQYYIQTIDKTKPIIVSFIIIWHYRAIWYDKDCYPSSWQLDPTEGPARVRRRLQRCHLGIPAKFLSTDKQKNYKQFPAMSLGYLFEDMEQTSNSSELKRKLQMNEKIRWLFEHGIVKHFNFGGYRICQ